MDNGINEILGSLDKAQKEAVCCIDGPELIVAGAGSGKTRVLTSRIAYMISKGVDPSRILALTFTKKAAGEMKDRIASMVGAQAARKLYMGTFHSVFIRFLREYSTFLGYPQSFTIYDTSDSTSAVKACVKELKLDEKVYKPKDVLGRISSAKNNLVTPEAYASNEKAKINDAHNKKPDMYKVYSLYQRKLREAGVMDFDDILLNMNILLDRNPEALDTLQQRFSHILVDEYQDTNFSQYNILMFLAKKHRNICVVGDDSQSIYAFRGAKVQNILNFQTDYKGCAVFRLEQNYRSTQNIVGAANSLIAKNANRIPKNCYSSSSEGDKIKLLKSYNDKEEAILIANAIVERMQSDTAQYEDFAILYRTNAQSRSIEEALRRRNLPYMIYSGHSFFDRAEVKDLMAYFKLVVNHRDNEAFLRSVNEPARGIGGTSLAALTQASQQKGLPLFETVYQEDLEDFGLKPAGVRKIRQFTDGIRALEAMMPVTDAYELAERICDYSTLLRMYKMDTSLESQSRAANIEELLNSVKAFVEERQNELKEDLLAEGKYVDITEIPDSELPVVTLGDYLENISLLSAVDVSDDQTNNKISMMTVHSAKGLEYPYVFVCGMEENLFPGASANLNPEELEEERRLFYVAITRAKKALSISFAGERMRNGEHKTNPPSRFLREIDSKYFENPLTDEDMEAQSEPSVSSWAGGFTSQRRYPYGGSATGGRFSNYGQKEGPSYMERKMSGRPMVIPRQQTVQQPSRVFEHTRPSMPASRPSAAYKPDPNFIPVPVSQIMEGQEIEHNRFGFGKVISIEGTGDKRTATIDFVENGQKKLLLNYAKLRFPKK